MRDLDQLRERGEKGEPQGSIAGRKYGLFALAGTMGLVAAISFGVVSGSSGSSEGTEPDTGLDPLAQLALASNIDPKAPPPAPKAQVQLERLSFPATLVGDDATLRAAEAEHALRTARTADVEHAHAKRARAEDVPVSTLASVQSDRLSRAAKLDPLVAQAIPERGGASVPPGSEGAFTLQVITFETRGAAERFAEALRARGHRAFVAQAELPGRGRSFRVRIGPFTTRRDALTYQTNFERSERMHSILVTSASK